MDVFLYSPKQIVSPHREETQWLDDPRMQPYPKREDCVELTKSEAILENNEVSFMPRRPYCNRIGIGVHHRQFIRSYCNERHGSE